METDILTDAELAAKQLGLEEHIKQNPRSSTLEKENLQEIKQEIQKRTKQRKAAKHEEILF